jgi:hypothetical protein
VTADFDSVLLLHSSEMVRRVFPDFLLVQARISAVDADGRVSVKVIVEPSNMPITTKAIGLNFIFPPNVQCWCPPAITEGQQTLAANGAQDGNQTYDLRMDIGVTCYYRLTTVRGPVMAGVATPTMS